MRIRARDCARMSSPSVLFLVGFNPDGVAVDVVEDHWVLKTPAGDVWKPTGLVNVQCVSSVLGLNVYVMLLW
jgi:hypothetical protein